MYKKYLLSLAIYNLANFVSKHFDFKTTAAAVVECFKRLSVKFLHTVARFTYMYMYMYIKHG